jgi:phosphoribosyl 1,2-cyclic phosphodiesterase
MVLKICSLASGSSGNATYVASDRSSLLVDCGASAREVTNRLAAIGTHPSHLQGILISHAHGDHYRSAGTLHARYGVPIYVDPTTARALSMRGRGTSWRRVRETSPLPDRIGDIEVRPLDTSHGFPPDEGRTVAFLLQNAGSRAGVITDLGVMTERIVRDLGRVDALILESNYDEARIRRKLSEAAFAADWPYLSWVMSDHGHLSNRQCADALAAIVRQPETHVFLGHLSENHHDPGRDNNDHRLAFDEVRRVFDQAGSPVPHLHRTGRIGREPSAPSALVEV